MNLDLAAKLCREFEGFRSKPYMCPAGIPTIGYGSTYYSDGRTVTLQDAPVTKEQADALLMAELQHTYAPGVVRLCPVLLRHPNRFNVAVDFCYNLGVGRLQTSTLRRKINAQDWEGAIEQLLLWNKAGGKVLPGLDRRCRARAALFH
jgi:lysozyme